MKISPLPKMGILKEIGMSCVRDSIFGGTVRSFCSAVAWIVGLAVGVGVVGVGVGALMKPDYLPSKTDLMIAPDGKGNRVLLSETAPAILRIDLQGVVGVGDLTSEKLESILLDSRENILKADRVKAVLLHINTPGGSASESDSIYRALVAYKEKYQLPVYAYVDGICASGGVFIASAADKIYATPSSVIGSVGVRMGPTFNFSEAMAKYGVSSLTLTEGKDKDALNPFRPWKEGEDTSLRHVLACLYDRFVSVVEKGRPRLTKNKLEHDLGAHIFIAKEAQEHGYVDASDSSYAQAVGDLAIAAGIQEEYQVVRLLPQHPLLSSLSQKTLLQWVGVVSPEQEALRGKFLYLYHP